MAKRRWIQNLLKKPDTAFNYLRNIVAGSFYKVSDRQGNSAISDIRTQIDVMRALAQDSQINTALSYYATDATTVNTSGQIIWATAKDGCSSEVADVINDLFVRWDVNSYARDHILELATIGNLYIPTTDLYKEPRGSYSGNKVALGINSIADNDFDIIPSYKIQPEDILHIYHHGEPVGYIVEPTEDNVTSSRYTIYPDTSVIHFSLGGLLGEYTIDAATSDGEVDIYDIKFATPMMDKAVQPTRTLNLLEDAIVLSSLVRTVKFVNVECGNAEEVEIQNTLQQIKDAIEQQMSLNTATGDIQSFVNPQSPNNLIYLPKIKGQDAISITDLNMSETNETDSKLLEYYQDKKLSVLGIPKEALNFSSNEGLGGAGSVLSQRSALYANSLQRLKTAYMAGWKSALDTYFTARGISGFIGTYDLHMSEIITEQSTITFEKRDAAIGQAQNIVDLMRTMGIQDASSYKSVLTEILTEVLPVTGSDVSHWNVDLDAANSEGGEL